MKNKVEKELNKRNKRFDFKGLFKNFVSGAEEELSEEEIILNDASLSDGQKKELIAGLAVENTLKNKIFGDTVESVKNFSKKSKIKEMNKEQNNSNLKFNVQNRNRKVEDREQEL